MNDTIKIEPITFDEYCDFCKLAGWPTPNEDRFKESIKKSTFIKYIEKEDTIGIGRAIKEYDGLYRIADVIVKREFQKRGIGKKILQSLIDLIQKDTTTKKMLIYLLTNRENIGFYKKIGFHVGKENKETGMKTMFLWIENK